MGGDGHRVTPEALRRHAGSVERVADGVEQARAAAEQVTLGREAYGKLPICQVLASLVEPLQQDGVAALRESVTALREVSDGLRRTAGQYAASEGQVAATFRADGAG